MVQNRANEGVREGNDPRHRRHEIITRWLEDHATVVEGVAQHEFTDAFLDYLETGDVNALNRSAETLGHILLPDASLEEAKFLLRDLVHRLEKETSDTVGHEPSAWSNKAFAESGEAVLRALEKLGVLEKPQQIGSAGDESGARRALYTVLDASREPVAIVDKQGKVQYANARLIRALGQKVEEVIGASFAGYVDEEGYERLRHVLRQRRGTAMHVWSGRLYCAGYTLDSCTFRVQPLLDVAGRRTAGVIFVDIPENEVRFDREILKRLADEVFSQVPLAIEVVDVSGRSVFQNTAASALASVIQTPRNLPLCCRLCRAQSSPECVCQKTLSEGQVYRRPSLPYGSDNTRCFSLVVVPIHSYPSGNRYAISLIQERTEQYQLEHALLTQQEVQGLQVVRALAHQLRNPLSIILGYADLLKTSWTDEEQRRRAVDKIQTTALRCREILEMLLTFDESVKTEAVEASIREVLAHDILPKIQKPPQIEVISAIPDGAHAVQCPREHLARILSILTENVLQTAARVIRISAAREAQKIRIYVEDDGGGGATEQSTRTGAPLVRKRSEHRSTDLGMTLAAMLAERYNGRVRLEPSEKDHTCYVLELPIAHNSGNAATDTKRKHAEDATHGARLLLIDDEWDLVEMLSAGAQALGWCVDIAHTAEEALPLLQKGGYDLIALDMHLPGALSGVNVFEYLEANRRELIPRVLVITADTLHYETRRFLQKKGIPFLEKPFTLNEFLARLPKPSA